MNDYENLLIGGRHSRKQIDDAKKRLKLKRELRKLGAKYKTNDPTAKLEKVLAKMIVKGRKY